MIRLRGLIALLLLAMWVPGVGTQEAPPPPPLRVHFIDVGQGDAVLIQSPSGQNVLYVDGSVEWHSTPKAGMNGDHIYNRGQGSCNMVPALSATDAVIQEP